MMPIDYEKFGKEKKKYKSYYCQHFGTQMD